MNIRQAACCVDGIVGAFRPGRVHTFRGRTLMARLSLRFSLPTSMITCKLYAEQCELVKRKGDLWVSGSKFLRFYFRTYI